MKSNSQSPRQDNISSNILNKLACNENILFFGEVYKYNQINWKQKRVLAITNFHVFNFKKQKVRRKIKVDDIEAITISLAPDSSQFIFHVPVEYDYRFESPIRHKIIKALQEAYIVIRNLALPVFGVQQKNLREFTTTQKDKKDGNFKFPLQDSLMEQQDISSVLQLEEDFQQIFEQEKDKSICLLPQKNQIPNSSLTLEDFNFIKKIGKGSYGKVFLVEKEGDYFAMKMLKKEMLITTSQIEYAKMEKIILQQGKHPFLASMKYVFQCPNCIYFVMKYYPGGDLYGLLRAFKTFPEEMAQFYAAQITLGIGYLHKKKILYRDIKGENILIDSDGYIGLADFGLAKYVEEKERTETFAGTIEYIAPEMFLDGFGYDRMVDWWSFGILLFEMLYGKTPFDHDRSSIIIENILSSNLTFPHPILCKNKVSTHAKDLITKLLKKDASKRLGVINDSDDIISHQFFKDLNFSSLLLRKVFQQIFEYFFKIPAPYIPESNPSLLINNSELNLEEIRKSFLPPEKMPILNKYEKEFKYFNQ